jgi:hypothetical protein
MPRTADEPSFSDFADRRAQGSVPRRTLVSLLDGVSGLGWSVIGFVGGAVFWHFIGFWSFVADVVLAGGPDAQLPSAALQRPDAAFVRVAEAGVPVSNCTAIALDRATGLSTASACEGEIRHLRDDAGAREDRLAPVRD